MFRAVVRGEAQGFGIRNSSLRKLLGKTSGQTSRILKRLRNHQESGPHVTRIWPVASGAATLLPEHPDAVYNIQFNPQSTRLLTCGHAGNFTIWNVANAQPLFTAKLPAVAYFATYSPDGTQAAAACANSKTYFVEIPEAAR